MCPCASDYEHFEALESPHCQSDTTQGPKQACHLLGGAGRHRATSCGTKSASCNALDVGTQRKFGYKELILSWFILFSQKKRPLEGPSTLKPFLFLRQTAGTCSSPTRQQGPRCTGQTGQNGLDPAVGLIKAVLANFASPCCTQPPPNL